jgi:hypothetical protein
LEIFDGQSQFLTEVSSHYAEFHPKYYRFIPIQATRNRKIWKMMQKGCFFAIGKNQFYIKKEKSDRKKGNVIIESK